MEDLGGALAPLIDVCRLVEGEGEQQMSEDPRARSNRKAHALAAFSSAWRRQFPPGTGAHVAAKAAPAALGVLSHVLDSTVLSASTSEHSCAEAATEALSSVLANLGPEGLAEVLPAPGALRLMVSLAMVLPLPSESGLDGRTRSEEEIGAALDCLLSLTAWEAEAPLAPQPTAKSRDLLWFRPAGAAEESRPATKGRAWREELSRCLSSSEEGRGALAQIIQAALVAARGGSLAKRPQNAQASAPAGAAAGGTSGVTGTWPRAQLPRALSVRALAVLDALLELLSQHPTVWRQFLPGMASQLYRLGARGAASVGSPALPEFGSAIGTLRTPGTIGLSAQGFGMAADHTRGRTAPASMVTALGLRVLSRAVALVCADAHPINSSVLPRTTVASDWKSLRMQLEADSLPGTEAKDSPQAAWRNAALGKLRVVLAGTLAAARAHESWRVR